MVQFHGIVVYEIIDNGRILNGIYTNSGNKLEVFNEVATLKSTESGIARYTLSINNGDAILTGEMDIETRGPIYILKQRVFENGKMKPAFEGFGFKSGNTHQSFTYWQTNRFTL